MQVTVAGYSFRRRIAIDPWIVGERLMQITTVLKPAPGRPLVPTSDRAPLAGAIKMLRSGETLFEEGDEADSAYEVESGLLRVYRLLPDGRRQITGFLSDGRIIGIPEEGVCTCSVEAATTTTLRRYRRAVYERRLDGEPGFARRLLKAAFLDLRQAEDQALLLGRKSATEKLASFLLQMSWLQGGADGITLPMCRSDIADYLGLTVETVSRAFTTLKSQGIIALKTPIRVDILERDWLESCADGLDG